MAARSKKNIAVGTQQGEGQVSLDTVVPISASSFTQPAEAGTNVEVGVFPISMPGAIGAPAPKGSAVSQIQLSDSTYTGGYSHTLAEMYGDGPESVPFSLPPREWTMDELKHKLEDVVGIDCSGRTRITFTGESDGLFQVETCHFDEGDHFELWSVDRFRLYLGCEAMKYDKNLLGDVLANYEYNGICGVDMYLYDIGPESNKTAWTEGSESLPANSPSGHKPSDATSKAGESDE